MAVRKAVSISRVPQCYLYTPIRKYVLYTFIVYLFFFSAQLHAQWSQTTAPTNQKVLCMVSTGSNVFAGFAGSGVYRSSDNGNSWTDLSEELPSDITINTLLASGSNLFAGTYGYGVYVTGNNGSTWDSVINGLPSAVSITTIVASGSYLFAGTDGYGVYVSSTSNVDSIKWTSSNSGLPANAVIKSMIINSSNIFIGTSNGTYRSNNNGATWVLVSTDLPSSVTVISFASKGTNIYSGTDGNGVYFSNDNGDSWSVLDSGMQTNATIYSLFNTSSVVFAGTAGAVLHTSDTTWSDVNTGLSSSYNVLSLTSNGNYLYAGTGNGIWKSIIPPAAPTSFVPAKKATNQVVDSLTLSWNSVSIATYYAVQLSTDSTFNTGVTFSSSGLTSPTVVVNGLSNNTVYYWRVNATNAGGTSGWSPVIKFTTTLLSPTQISPANNTTNQAVALNLSWNTVTSATSYGLQVSTDSSFATSVFVSKSGLTSTTQSVSGLANNTKYFWRVNATNIGGTSEWSSNYVFTTIVAVPEKPLLTQPSDNVVGQPVTITLKWDSISSATSYTLQVSADSTFTNSTIYSKSDLTTTSQTITGLANSTVYFWRARAANIAGTGSYSSTYRFATILGAPQPSSPANKALNQALSLTLSWGQITLATSYALQVSTDSSFSNSSAIHYNQGGITTTSQTISDLTSQTIYYWRVNATNAGGTGIWSTIYHFTTNVGTPESVVLRSPINGAQGQSLSMVLSWDTVSGASSYSLQVSTDSAFASSVIVNKTEITLPTQTINGLNNNTVYYWRVNAVNTAGTGVWSSLHYFTTVLAAPVPSTPANNVTNQAVSLTLAWKAVTAANTYALQVSTDSTFVTENSNAYNKGGLAATSQVVSDLLNSTVYYWRVNGSNAGGTGSWSAVYSFTTCIATPDVPALVSPLNTATNQPLSLALSWNAISTASSYSLQVSTDSTFASSIIVNKTELSSTTQTINGLTNNTVYYWRISAVNSSGTNGWSSIYRFTTVLAAPVLSAPVNNAINQAVSVTLSWKAITSAVSYAIQVSEDSTFSSTLAYDLSGITTTSQAVTDLSNKRIYFWRVNAANDGGTGNWSTVYRFTTIIANPDAPQQKSPTDNAASQPLSFTFSWDTIATATSYTFQLSTDTLFASGIILNKTGLTTSVQAISGLTNNTVYCWRICAVNSAGTGVWSSIYKFTTLMHTPTLLSPANKLTSQPISISFQWNADTIATVYSLQVIAGDSTFSGTCFFNQNGIKTAKYTVSGLANNTTYYWRIQSSNAYGSSDWTSPYHFTTAFDAPALVSPVNYATNQSLTPVLTWNSVASAASYLVQVSKDSTFSKSLIFNQSGITTTTQTISGLANYTTYYWKVYAVNSDGTRTGSSTYSFSTLIASPEPSSPVNDTINQSVDITLIWDTVVSAISYAVQLSTNNTFTSTVFIKNGITTLSQVVNDLTLNTKYYWRVNATNAGGTSAWSTIYIFKTVAMSAPVLSSPVNDSTNITDRPELSWYAIDTALYYSLEVSTDSLFRKSFSYDEDSLIDTAITIGSLTKEVKYFWRVRATNNSGISEWSEVRNFTTEADSDDGQCGVGSLLSLIPPLIWKITARRKKRTGRIKIPKSMKKCF
jgi:hypothetical protein